MNIFLDFTRHNLNNFTSLHLHSSLKMGIYLFLFFLSIFKASGCLCFRTPLSYLRCRHWRGSGYCMSKNKNMAKAPRSLPRAPPKCPILIAEGILYINIYFITSFFSFKTLFKCVSMLLPTTQNFHQNETKTTNNNVAVGNISGALCQPPDALCSPMYCCIWCTITLLISWLQSTLSFNNPCGRCSYK